MAFSRDVERLARMFVRQRLDRAYIVHYLMETYQLDLADAEAVVAKVAGTAPAAPGQTRREAEDPARIRRQGFF